MITFALVVAATLAGVLYLGYERIRARRRERRRLDRVMRHAEMRYCTNRRVTAHAYDDRRG